MYGTAALTITPTGQVGIGTGTAPLGTMKLAVEGTIGAREVKVTLSKPWPDYVFEENYKLIPQKGVYVVQSLIDKKTVNGIMNIGINPTVGGEVISVEVYFLDFNGDLYDQEIQVALLEYVRPEQKFDSISLLKAQLEKDKADAISFFKAL